MTVDPLLPPLTMTAQDVLRALRRHHHRAAIVPEISIADDWSWARWEDSEHNPLDWPVTARRIDALMFEQRVRTAIEIKVSRGDAKRESHHKIHPWRRVVHRYYYAVPAGLIERPPVYGCGLWWVHANGRVEVRVKTKPNLSPEPLPLAVVQNLAYRAAGMEEPK